MSDEHIPQYVEDITNPDDPRQALAFAISEWPAFGNQQQMPTSLPMVPYQSEHLCKLGLRYHPELAVLHKVRDPKTGRTKFASDDDLAEMDFDNATPPPKPSTMESRIEDMLSRVTADIAAEIKDMPAEERAAKAEQMAPLMEESLKSLLAMKKGLENDTP